VRATGSMCQQQCSQYVCTDEMCWVRKRHKAMSAMQTRECTVSISNLLASPVSQIATSDVFLRSIDVVASLAQSTSSIIYLYLDFHQSLDIPGYRKPLNCFAVSKKALTVPNQSYNLTVPFLLRTLSRILAPPQQMQLTTQV
jgi:hypothetical protein